MDGTKKLTIALIVIISILIVIAIIFIILASVGVFSYTSSPYNTELNESIEVPDSAFQKMVKDREVPDGTIWASNKPLFNLASPNVNSFMFEMDVYFETLDRNFVLFSNTYQQKGQIMVMVEDSKIVCGLNGDEPLIFYFTEILETKKKYNLKFQIQVRKEFSLKINDGEKMTKNLKPSWNFCFDYFNLCLGGKRDGENQAKNIIPPKNAIILFSIFENQTLKHKFTYHKSINEFEDVVPSKSPTLLKPLIIT